MTSPFKIFIYEPEHELGIQIRDYLLQSNIPAVLFSDKDELYKEGVIEESVLAIVGLPEEESSGLTVAEDIKERNENISLVFLSRSSGREALVNAFTIGADDYIRIPFDRDELVCRIKAILRRLKSESQPKNEIRAYRIGGLFFDTQKQTLQVGETAVKLTTKESDLLNLLCLHANELLEREYVLQKIWLNDSYFSARSMDVYITKLRKLLRAEPSVAIINVHGKGYKLVTGKSAS